MYLDAWQSVESDIVYFGTLQSVCSLTRLFLQKGDPAHFMYFGGLTKRFSRVFVF